MCNLNKEKWPLFLFHSLTLSLYSSLIFHTDCTSSRCSSHLCFSHNGRMLSVFFSTQQGRMAFASFFSFSSTCPTCFATLLNKRSQTMFFASLNFLSSFSLLDMLQSSLVKRHDRLEDFWNQAHNWALTRHVGSKWAGLQGCHMHPTISPSNTLRRRSSTQVLS